MKKREDLKLSKDGLLPDGSLRFVVKLPPDISALFLEEMRVQERKKMPMARHIITLYFRDKFLRKDYDEFIQHRGTKVRDIPHFGDAQHLPRASGLRKGPRSA